MKCPSSVILLLFAFLGQCVVCCYGAVVQTRCPAIRLNNGKVRIRARGRIIRFNCLDGYTLVGDKYSTCVRGKWDTPVPVCVNAECPLPPTPPAHVLVASKLDGAILMFFCEPGYSLIGTAEIYCDGRRWNESFPSCRDTNASAPTKCDFEDPDLCWWEQDPQHDFDWKRHNFETPSLHIGTGPTHDHTLGAGNDGHYLYIEASGRLVNDTARIISPLYNSSLTKSGCFSFWYHMYGATIGVLNIYFKPETESTPRLMFSKAGNQGNNWFHGVFDLPRTNISFQIVIEGVRGSSYVSDIAIDDIAILQGDECVDKNESIGMTVGYDDQVEVVNAQETCRNRCSYGTTTEPAAFSAPPPFGPESCQCTLDCAERSICCPDYIEYCILGYVTGPATTTSETKLTISSTVTNVTRSPGKNDPAGGKSTRAPVRNFTLTGFPINPKDDIDPGTSTSSTSTATRIKPVTSPTTTPIGRTTKRPSRTTISVERTQRPETRETAVVPRTLTTKYVELQDRSGQEPERKLEKVKHGGGRFVVLENVAAVVGATLVALVLALAIAIVVVRRRRSYKRGASGSALSEDSDVRFLTSDEILDFNLARPTDNDEL